MTKIIEMTSNHEIYEEDTLEKDIIKENVTNNERVHGIHNLVVKTLQGSRSLRVHGVYNLGTNKTPQRFTKILQ